MFDPRLVPVGYQQIAAFSTLQTLTVPTGATCALIRTETNTVRWRDDGTSPTASVGMPLIPGDDYLFYNGTLSVLAFIPATGSATLNVVYYK